MARNTGPGHDKSDRALDKRAFDEAPKSKQHWSAAEVRKHDDDGRDRLFEGREQHDEADKNQDKLHLKRDIDRHGHDPDHLPNDAKESRIGKQSD